MDEAFDLFGDPVRLPSGRRGRPAHVRSQKNDNKIMMLQAMGWSQQRIANALHISVPTLKRYYSSILKLRDIQRDRFDAWRLELAAEESAKGNVGAMRLLDKLVEKNDAMNASARLRDEPEEEEQTPEKVGKKRAAAARARDLVESPGEESPWGGDLTPGYRN